MSVNKGPLPLYTITLYESTEAVLVSAHSFTKDGHITATTTHQGWWLAKEDQVQLIAQYIRSSIARKAWGVKVMCSGVDERLVCFENDFELKLGKYTIKSQPWPKWYSRMMNIGHNGAPPARLVIVNNDTHCHREIGLMSLNKPMRKVRGMNRYGNQYMI